MAEPFLAEIRMAGFNFAPRGWAFCNGQILPINQNQALFSLLGTIYGGDGRTTFALPDLRGRTPIHTGEGFIQGAIGGAETHTLTADEIPNHSHTLQGGTANADAADPTGRYFAAAELPAYGPPSNRVETNNPTSPIGGNQPHNNMQPYLALSYIIAITGTFPSRN